MKEKSTETAQPSSWKITNSRLTTMSLHGMKLDPPYLRDSTEDWTTLGITGSRIRIYSWCINQLVGAYSLWWDAMFRLNAGGRDLILPQLNVPQLVDYPSEALLIEKSGWEVVGLREMGRKIVVVIENKIKSNK